MKRKRVALARNVLLFSNQEGEPATVKPWGTLGIAVAVVISAALFTHAYENRARVTHQVSVVGSGSGVGPSSMRLRPRAGAVVESSALAASTATSTNASMAV